MRPLHPFVTSVMLTLQQFISLLNASVWYDRLIDGPSQNHMVLWMGCGDREKMLC